MRTLPARLLQDMTIINTVLTRVRTGRKSGYRLFLLHRKGGVILPAFRMSWKTPDRFSGSPWEQAGHLSCGWMIWRFIMRRRRLLQQVPRPPLLLIHVHAHAPQGPQLRLPPLLPLYCPLKKRKRTLINYTFTLRL